MDDRRVLYEPLNQGVTSVDRDTLSTAKYRIVTRCTGLSLSLGDCQTQRILGLSLLYRRIAICDRGATKPALCCPAIMDSIPLRIIPDPVRRR